MKKAIAFVMGILFFICTACTGAESQEYSSEVFAMDTYMLLKAYGDNGEKALKQAQDALYELDAMWSVTDENSEIYNINANGEGKVSDETAQIISFACQMGELTNGALDISIYPVMKAWGFTTGEYTVPQEDEIDKLIENVDYTQITCTEDEIYLPEGMEIDLGAVAKGWAGDMLSEIMQENGVQSAILTLGGNIQTVGVKPDGSKWNVAIEHPDKTGYIAVVSVADCAVVTSGGYERFFEDEQGNVYWHILDPDTGYPANSGIISATIIGPEGKKCDALSTAVFVMGLDKAVQLWSESDDFEMVIMTEDKKVYVTEGIQGDYTPMDVAEYEVIYR